jgi:hypothetical protein
MTPDQLNAATRKFLVVEKMSFVRAGDIKQP